MTNYIKYYGLIALTLFAVSGCGQLFQKPVKTPVKAVKVQKTDAASFVQNLATARIILAQGGSLSDIAENSKIIENYTKQKKAKPSSLTLIILEYKNASGKTERAIAPMSENSNLTSLSNVLTPLGSTSYKLKDVQIQSVQVSPGMPIKIGTDIEAAKQAINSRHQAIIDSAHKIAPLQEAKLQLKLLRYFMGAQNRDAAYICADNAKRLLSHDGVDRDAGNQLAKDLEVAEGELRQTMPY